MNAPQPRLALLASVLLGLTVSAGCTTGGSAEDATPEDSMPASEEAAAQLTPSPATAARPAPAEVESVVDAGDELFAVGGTDCDQAYRASDCSTLWHRDAGGWDRRSVQDTTAELLGLDAQSLASWADGQAGWSSVGQQTVDGGTTWQWLPAPLSDHKPSCYAYSFSVTSQRVFAVRTYDCSDQRKPARSWSAPLGTDAWAPFSLPRLGRRPSSTTSALMAVGDALVALIGKGGHEAVRVSSDLGKTWGLPIANPCTGLPEPDPDHTVLFQRCGTYRDPKAGETIWQLTGPDGWEKFATLDSTYWAVPIGRDRWLAFGPLARNGDTGPATLVTAAGSQPASFPKGLEVRGAATIGTAIYVGTARGLTWERHGVYVSYDGGLTWKKEYAAPVADHSREIKAQERLLSNTRRRWLRALADDLDPSYQHLDRNADLRYSVSGKQPLAVLSSLDLPHLEWRMEGQSGAGMVQLTVFRRWADAEEQLPCKFLETPCESLQIAGASQAVRGTFSDHPAWGDGLFVGAERPDGTAVVVTVSTLFGNNYTTPVSGLDLTFGDLARVATDQRLQLPELN